MSRNTTIAARVPPELDDAIRAVAIRAGITRAEAIQSLLLRGLEASRSDSAVIPAPPTPAAEVVFPPRLALLLVEIAALATLTAKQVAADRSQIDQLRRIYRAEFLG